MDEKIENVITEYRDSELPEIKARTINSDLAEELITEIDLLIKIWASIKY